MATAIMALVIAMSGGATAQPRSNDDYCRLGGAARLVLIDVTTPYDAADRHTIEAMLRDKRLVLAHPHAAGSYRYFAGMTLAGSIKPAVQGLFAWVANDVTHGEF